ncbi:MAG TPA: carbohydrate ABC transporter permease [Chthoniobacterales bacterium]|jgi:ABC-type glycerol-3-phosphate transport system permease component
MKFARTFGIYLLLAGGSLVFVWPFLWMAATSAKLDRELFSETLRLLPERPIPQIRSPYVDDREYSDLKGPRLSEALGMIEADLAAANFPWPNDVDGADLRRQVARGIYARLLGVLPANDWTLPSAELRARIAAQIRPELIANLVAQLRRAIALGALRAQSFAEEENVFPSGNGVWKIAGAARAAIVASPLPNEHNSELHYDFSRGDVVSLSQVLRTTFPVTRLRRLLFPLRYDDTWHALKLVVEKDGRRYDAARTVPLADHEWVVDTRQEHQPNDRETTARNWTWLEPAGRSAIVAPNELRITLQLERSNQLEAWWAKIGHNYRLTFDQIPFWRYVGTSLFLVILNLIGTLFSCSLVAYSFARLQWPGRNVCFALLLATMMIPAQVTMIPQFLIMQKLGWYNTLRPLWIASFVAPAFYVFLLRQFLKGIPRDLEDAARLDGCGYLRIYWHIMLPLVRPTLAAIAIFTFLATWNEFMAPLIYLADQRLYPLSFGLYAFQVQITNPGTAKGMGMVMAASLLMTLPVIAIFFFAQRYFLRGVTLTGIKG